MARSPVVASLAPSLTSELYGRRERNENASGGGRPGGPARRGRAGLHLFGPVQRRGGRRAHQPGPVDPADDAVAIGTPPGGGGASARLDGQPGPVGRAPGAPAL